MKIPLSSIELDLLPEFNVRVKDGHTVANYGTKYPQSIHGEVLGVDAPKCPHRRTPSSTAEAERAVVEAAKEVNSEWSLMGEITGSAFRGLDAALARLASAEAGEK
jgi:hypothetical protein